MADQTRLAAQPHKISIKRGFMIIDLSAAGRSSSRRNIGAKPCHLGCLLAVEPPGAHGFVISCEMLERFIDANRLNVATHHDEA